MTFFRDFAQYQFSVMNGGVSADMQVCLHVCVCVYVNVCASCHV